MNNSLDAILLTIPDGRIISANRAACEMFGMTEEEIIKNGRNGLVDLEDPRLLELIEKREKEGKARGELRLRRKDGTIFPADVTSSLF